MLEQLSQLNKQCMWYKMNKWFELNWGWFFINGRKQGRYAAYLIMKYGKL